MDLTQFPLWLKLVLFLLSFYCLVKGADLFVDGASAIARILGISELLIGLTIVALGTSAPEFAVSTMASFEGAGDMALANVVGSNIFNLGFILAICCILKPLYIEKEIIKRDMLVILFSVGVLTFFAWQGTITRLGGALLLIIFLGYIIYLFLNGKKQEQAPETTQGKKGLWKELIKMVIGLTLLLAGSKLLVNLAIEFAEYLGVSQWVIGITIIAAGTSLPELVTAVTSVLKNKSGIGIGNLIGSDIFNILAVIGSAALLRPIEIYQASFPSILIFLASIVTLIALMGWRWRLGRVHGVLLMGVSIVRWAIEIM